VHVLIVHNAVIPVFTYGGTERVVWNLGRKLVELGHRVTFLVPEGSQCDFAPLLPLQSDRPWHEQVPRDVDLVHFHFDPRLSDAGALGTPFVFTEHGNAHRARPLPRNTIFLSGDHAARYGSTEFVHNGLDWSTYGGVDFTRPRTYAHFLGKGSWPVKNLAGAIAVARRARVELEVLGAGRFSFRRSVRMTLSRRVRFHGMVGGREKSALLNGSRGIVFPVRWHEPFGLAVIESLYFGCPVFATPYGSLPELVPGDCGVLAADASTLAQALSDRTFDARACHAHAVGHFGAEKMAVGYLRCYERVLAGELLNRASPAIRGEARSLPWRG